MEKIRLGVNLDHVATLRQVRGGKTEYPDLLFFVKEVQRARADQITIHLREDRRHIQDKDVKNIIQKSQIPVNLEMAVTEPMIRIALKHRPRFVCLVPENPQELTTEGGLDVVKNKSRISKCVERLSKKGIGVSIFVGASLNQVRAAADVGAFACEFHTGHWVAYKGDKKQREWKRLCQAAQLCHSLGLKVHAGHGLNYTSAERIKKLPYIEEVNIGHFLICDGLKNGLHASVKKMIQTLK